MTDKIRNSFLTRCSVVVILMCFIFIVVSCFFQKTGNSFYQYGTKEGALGSAELCFTKNKKHYCEIIKEVDWFAYYEEKESK